MGQLVIIAGTVSAAGAIGGTTGLDISGVTGDFTIRLTVRKLTSASGTPRARIVIEDTVNAFTASIPIVAENIEGPFPEETPVTFSWRKYEVPSLRAGIANAKIRINVVELSGTTPSLAVEGFVDTP
jgi:hypothetical protein